MNRIFLRVAAVLAFLVLASFLVFFLVFPLVVRTLGGAFGDEPENMAGNLSPKAESLLEAAFADLDPDKLRDHHVHIVGLGRGTDAFVNPDALSVTHPFRYLRSAVFKSAAGIDDDVDDDRAYVDRLERLIDAIPGSGRFHFLAFDKHYESDGSVNLTHTEFYVPNELVWELSQRSPRFIPAISIHPYRADAIAELERWAAKGVRHMKLLPNAMGIDFLDERLIPFYEALAKHDITLLTHAGDEKSVEAEEHLGNPLRLRLPLDHGVRLIVAHCASLGVNDDLDNPGGPAVSNFELFLRLLEDPKYDGQIYGDLSAIHLENRIPGPLMTLLERPELHDKLVNGSDYPVIAINFALRTKDLVEAGFIQEDERMALNEIYEFNPLLFDYVVKRTLRHPTTGAKLSPEVFTNETIN